MARKARASETIAALELDRIAKLEADMRRVNAETKEMKRQQRQPVAVTVAEIREHQEKGKRQ